MSCMACAWAMYETPHDLDANEYRTLVMLGDWANEDNVVYETEADMDRVLERYGADIRAALQGLERRGLVETQEMLDLSVRIELRVPEDQSWLTN